MLLGKVSIFMILSFSFTNMVYMCLFRFYFMPFSKILYSSYSFCNLIKDFVTLYLLFCILLPSWILKYRQLLKYLITLLIFLE